MRATNLVWCGTTRSSSSPKQRPLVDLAFTPGLPLPLVLIIKIIRMTLFGLVLTRQYHLTNASLATSLGRMSLNEEPPAAFPRLRGLAEVSHGRGKLR
jgi:hypothetical protein